MRRLFHPGLAKSQNAANEVQRTGLNNIPNAAKKAQCAGFCNTPNAGNEAQCTGFATFQLQQRHSVHDFATFQTRKTRPQRLNFQPYNIPRIAIDALTNLPALQLPMCGIMRARGAPDSLQRRGS